MTFKNKTCIFLVSDFKLDIPQSQNNFLAVPCVDLQCSFVLSLYYFMFLKLAPSALRNTSSVFVELSSSHVSATFRVADVESSYLLAPKREAMSGLPWFLSPLHSSH